MKFKILSTILLCSLFSFASYSQDYNYVEEEEEKEEPQEQVAIEEEEEDEEEKEQIPLSERMVFGGNVGFQFGDITVLDFSPLVGYKITEQLIGGAGFTYQFFQDRRFSRDYSSTILGGRVFGRYMVTPQIFPHVEYESLSIQFQDSFGTEQEREWFNSFLAGAGLAQPLGRRGAINILVLYNLSWDSNQLSIYNSPWITRVGFVF